MGSSVVELREIANELLAKVQYLVDYLEGRGLLEEHCFTFPDGDTWWATGYTQ